MESEKKLKMLFDEYLNTLDDKEYSEWYATKFHLQRSVLNEFRLWLRNEKQDKVKE